MTAVVKQAAGFVETAVDAEIVVMRLADGDFFSLDGSAMAVWEAIDGQRGRAEIIGLIGDQFEQSPEALAADVNAFLDDLAAAGLISG